MSHAFAISLSRPHEALGLPIPFSRRIPRGLVIWNVFLFGVTLLLTFGYVFLVNVSASQSYILREVEKRVEGLNNETMALEDSIASLSSLQSLSARAADIGFVPVDRVAFVNPASPSYALK